MWTHNRSKLIKDLNESALGLIREAEYASPEQAAELIELASNLDRLRVSMLQHRNRPIISTQYTSMTPANCA
jgi:hypothetical protein